MELGLFRDVTDELWAMYQESFPYCEQRDLERHLEILQEANFRPYVVRCEGKDVGLMFVWCWEHYFYIEHFATSPAIRGGGIGAKALKIAQDICVKEGRVMILEIDPPETEIAIRRRGFYERLGLIMNDYNHIHPSYRKGETPYPLRVMSWPRLISDTEFKEFQRYSFSVL